MYANVGPESICPQAVAESPARLSTWGDVGARNCRMPAMLNLQAQGWGPGHCQHPRHGPSMYAKVGPESICPLAVAESPARLSAWGDVGARNCRMLAMLNLQAQGWGPGDC